MRLNTKSLTLVYQSFFLPLIPAFIVLIKREILNQVRRWLVIWPITALLPSIIFGDTHFTSMEHSGLIPPEFIKMRGMKVPFLASSFACSNMPLSALSLILVELGQIV